MIQIRNYIGGKLIEPVCKNYLDNYNPATGEVYSQVPDSDEQDVELAVQAAQGAFEDWSNMPAEQRCKLLLKIADFIDSKLDYLAEVESIDSGKPKKLAAIVDIPRASFNFRFFATAVLQFPSESHNRENSAVNYTLRQPIGVVAGIS